MSQREKILIGLMILAIGYGIFVWFLSPPQPEAILKADTDQNSLNAFIIKVAEKTTGGLSKFQKNVLEKAEARWKRDPLIQIKPQPAVEEEENQEPVLTTKMIYTGFLQMGDKRLAIINGMEYETGDRLEPGGFLLQSISPTRVVIAPRGKKSKSISLPLEDTE